MGGFFGPVKWFTGVLGPFKKVFDGFQGVKGVIALEVLTFFTVFDMFSVGRGSTVHCMYGFFPSLQPWSKPWPKIWSKKNLQGEKHKYSVQYYRP